MAEQRFIKDTQLEKIPETLKKLRENFHLLNADIVRSGMNAYPKLEFRKQQILNLKKWIEDNEAIINEAMRKDLGLTPADCVGTNHHVTDTISKVVEKLKKWADPKQLPISLVSSPGTAYVSPQGKGVVCIIGSWNVPLTVTINPLIYAICAGNCVLVKPSELAPACSGLIAKMIEESLDNKFYACIQGGIQTGIVLGNTKFDGFCFTGGSWVGGMVAESCGKNLTPTIMELGGKSPAIVEGSADVDLAAKRIVSTKFLNCGQICITVDYVLCHAAIYEEFKEKCVFYAKKFFTKDVATNPNWSKIVHSVHSERQWGLLDDVKDKIIFQGGEPDHEKRLFPPTIVDNPDLTAKCMQQECFSPILPIRPYNRHDEVLSIINERSRP